MTSNTLERLPEEAIILLDMMYNSENIQSRDVYAEYLSFLKGVEGEELAEKAWESLNERGILVKGNYGWSIDESLGAGKELSTLLERKGITSANTQKEFERMLKTNPEALNYLVQMLGKIYRSQKSKRIDFSDYEWNSPLGKFLDNITTNEFRPVFRMKWSSKKHEYQDYFIRVWPFDCGEIIEKIVLKNLNVEGLSNQVWKAILLLLLSRNLSAQLITIKDSLNITELQLNETLSLLVDRKFVNRYSPSSFSLVNEFEKPLGKYYSSSVYQHWKKDVISVIRQESRNAISTLWILLEAKRLYDALAGSDITEPIRCRKIPLSEAEKESSKLGDIIKLGLAVKTDTDVVILSDILGEVLEWLKGALQDYAEYVPANYHDAAVQIFTNMFSSCKEYIKIQDPYVTEETFDFIQFAPANLRIQLLTGINFKDEVEVEEVVSQVEANLNERGENFNVWFIGKDDGSGKAPFHTRIIMTKEGGWLLDNSISQAGKKKPMIIRNLPADFVQEIAEPEFERLWKEDPDSLKKLGYLKLDVNQWKKLKSQHRVN